MRLPFWASVFTVLGVVVLCALGYWQVKRAQWKAGILQEVAAEYAVDASVIPLDIHALEEYSGFKRGFFRGRYLHDQAVFLQPRTHEGAAGYHVLTPFEIEEAGGVSILVNRGWVPVERERGADFSVDMPRGIITVTGMLRRPARPNAFTPENAPERGVWYREDLTQIARVQKVDLLPRVLFFAESEEGRGGVYPVVESTRIALSDYHRQYAVFWFVMAALLCVVYVFRFVRR